MKTFRAGNRETPELRRLASDIEAAAGRADPFAELQELHSEPEKVREGMLALADGADWNPGSGGGLYLRSSDNASWHAIGRGLKIVHASWFGAVADGVTDQAAAFARIMASGATDVYLDAGTYYFPRTANGSTTSGLVVQTANMRFHGAGKNVTIIAEGQTTLTYSGNLWWLNTDVSATFKDLTFQGSTTQPTAGDAAPLSTAVACQDNPGNREVRFENVNFTGWFTCGFQKSQGTGAGYFLLEMRNCEIRPYHGCVKIFAADDIDAHFHAYDTEFTRGGIPAADPGFPYDHALYIHPHINLHFERCRWPEVNGNKFALHHFSGAGKTSTYAKYAKFIDCDFRQTAGTPGAVFEQSDVIHMEFVRCKFGGDGYASLVKPVGATFRDCGDDNSPCELLLNNAFGGGSLSILGGVWKQRTGSLGNTHALAGTWTIKRSKILATVNNAVAFVEVKGTATKLMLWNVEFESTLTGTDRSSSPILASAGSALIEVKGCTIRGTYGLSGTNGFISLFGTYAGTVRVSHLDSVDFDGTTGILVRAVAAVPAATLQITNSALGDAPFRVDAGGNYQLVSPSRGVSPTAIASASSISISYRYDAYRVSGTTAIANILANADTKSQSAYSGSIRLIATGAWSLANTGNILPRSTAARTVNEVVTLTYDPVTATWYE